MILFLLYFNLIACIISALEALRDALYKYSTTTTTVLLLLSYPAIQPQELNKCSMVVLCIW